MPPSFLVFRKVFHPSAKGAFANGGLFIRVDSVKEDKVGASCIKFANGGLFIRVGDAFNGRLDSWPLLKILVDSVSLDKHSGTQ